MAYINMDPKLIRNGGRKAPKISEDEFLKHLSKALNFYVKNDEVDIDFEPVHFDSRNLKKMIDEEDYDTLYILAIYAYDRLNNDLKMDDGCMENFKFELTILETGIPGLLFRGGGDWQHPYAYFIYYDGKKIRGYIPRYGNTINLNTKEPIGNNYEEDNLLIEKEMKKAGIERKADDDYIDIEINHSAILKDIESRIEAF